MRSRARISSHPLHPIFVVFPLGLWITAFIFDLIGRATGEHLSWAASFYGLVAGCVGAACAAVFGVIDLFTTVPPRSSGRRTGYLHGSLNSLALLLFIYVAWRRGGPWFAPDRTSLLLEALGVLGILYSGWLGGTLVYRNQIGVDHRFANAGKMKERSVDNFDRPVCGQGELAAGQAMLIHVGSERIAITRCEDGFFAIGDRCSHRGGPLSDGAIVGCAVQCPWHGSQFDLRTGRILAGPAEHPIKTYRVEVLNGEVYVRPPASTPVKKAA